MMNRLRDQVSAVSLVLAPLLLLVYWALYPAYGKLKAADVITSAIGHASMMRIADVFMISSVLLMVPATLAFMRFLRSVPALALIGGSMTLLGWIAVLSLGLTDVVATHVAELGPNPAFVTLFSNVTGDPIVIGLNVIASLHIVGGVLIGIALIRSKLIPLWLAVAATLAPPVHLFSNLGGLLWLDSITWVVMAVVGSYVARGLLRDSRSTGPAEA